MALPASGQISFSQIAQIVYNSSSATVSLNDSDVRKLLATASGQISISSGYSKPTAANYNYTSAGTYTLVTPAYQNMSIDARGGGQGGNGGSGSDTCTGWCGQFCFFPYCCNGSGGGAGGAGNPSYLRLSGVVDVTAYGGSSSGSGSGYGGTVTVGGGGAGGTMGYAFGCSGSNGSQGYPGGRTVRSLTKGLNGPAYSTSLSIAVGAGGGGGYNAGGTGGTGAVYVSFS